MSGVAHKKIINFHSKAQSVDVLSFVMAGGRGTRLKILTKDKCKPAINIFGRYKIFDFVASNIANTGIDAMITATQFKPEFLHQHIGSGDAWGFDRVDKTLEIVDPQEEGGDTRFEGTADSVRKSIHQVDRYRPNIVLVLGSDHVYSMDYTHAIKQHKANNANITIMTSAVPDSKVSDFGIVKIDQSNRIIDFAEKPRDRETIEDFRLSDDTKKRLNIRDPNLNFLASMGNYVFFWDRLRRYLDFSGMDFGKDIIPAVEGNFGALYAYVFNGYWRDVGTIRRYFDCNMEFTNGKRPINFLTHGIRTNESHRTVARVATGSSILRSILSPGDMIHSESSITDCVLGSWVVIGKGCSMDKCILLGTHSNGLRTGKEHITRIGKNSNISSVIMDEGVRIGDCVNINPNNGSPGRRAEILQNIGLKPYRELGNGTIEGDFYIEPDTGILVIGRSRKTMNRGAFLPSGTKC
jgi:glucose-1-phosphate adenylyltransferase